MSDPIIENFDWYVQNLSILLSLYPGKYIIIRDKQVVAACDSYEEAKESAFSRGIEPGNYNIQYCGDMDSYRRVLNPFHLDAV